jgi:hypothetical protein
VTLHSGGKGAGDDALICNHLRTAPVTSHLLPRYRAFFRPVEGRTDVRCTGIALLFTPPGAVPPCMSPSGRPPGTTPP